MAGERLFRFADCWPDVSTDDAAWALATFAKALLEWREGRAASIECALGLVHRGGISAAVAYKNNKRNELLRAIASEFPAMGDATNLARAIATFEDRSWSRLAGRRDAPPHLAPLEARLFELFSFCAPADGGAPRIPRTAKHLRAILSGNSIPYLNFPDAA